MSRIPDNQRDLALVGVGDWGRHLARCFESLGALAALVACEADDRGRAELLSAFPRARVHTSVADVLRDPSIRKVAIAAPSAVHFELARAAIAAGKDVFVEKPLCLQLGQARLLTESALRGQRILMVGHLLRYHPCVIRLRELVLDGELGRVLTITSSRLNLGKLRKEENVLWSFAPHDVSVILGLMGDKLPSSLRCSGGAYLNPSVADSTLTLMRFDADVLAQIHVSWLSPFKEQKLTVVGSEGMAVFDDTLPWPEKLRLYRRYLRSAPGEGPALQSPAREVVPVSESEPLLEECRHFLDACRTRRAPLTDGAEGVRVLEVLDMAERSLQRDGEAIRAPSAEPAFFAHPTATVEPGARIGAGTRIWHHSSVMGGACVGARCNLGQNVHVASGAVLGDDVKVQNNVSIYGGVEVEDSVFLGPSCVLTNVKNPRSEVNRRALYQKTRIRRGATVGANATIVCGVTLGRYAFVAAGAVVVSDAPDYSLMVGNPARHCGYMSRHGHRLRPGADGIMVCPEHGLRYRELEPGVLRCLDLAEDAALPDTWRGGTRTYDELKA